MKTTSNHVSTIAAHGITSRLLAGLCHHCAICPTADRRPDSPFGRLMRWHRGWCPAWAAHTKVYGRKPLS